MTNEVGLLSWLLGLKREGCELGCMMSLQSIAVIAFVESTEIFKVSSFVDSTERV